MRSNTEKRLMAIEKRVLVRLTPIEITLCENDSFRRMVSSIGLDIDSMKRNGKVIGALPRDLLQRIVIRLAALSARRAGEV